MIEETKEETNTRGYDWQKQRDRNFRMAVYQILGLALSIKSDELIYTASEMADEILQILEEQALLNSQGQEKNYVLLFT